ncbi:MAG: hypothetical protein MZV49_24975 [Rhodopseudomonas palustris]|nr:hypothetical protein [Rhodopseudomonas palustris]
MASVWGTLAGLSVKEISIFIAIDLCRRPGAAISDRLDLGPDGPAAG